MNVEGLFPTPFLFAKFNLDNQKLIDFAYNLKKTDPGEPRDGGWQSPWLDFNNPEIKELVDVVQEQMTQMSSNLFGIKKEYNIKLMNGWVNINEPNGDAMNNNYYHMHGPYFISFVYYAKTPEGCGNLTLVPPHGFLDYVIPEQLIEHMSPFNTQRYHVLPEAGKMVAFPGYITHFANINKSTEDRISFAFNGMIENRNIQ